jgi:Holliday junction resolvase RusA-like endonuclease
MNHSDPPFAVPPAILHVIDLPRPPSVNRIWHNNHRSLAYKSWIEQADNYIMSHGGMRGRQPIKGHFTALIEIKPHTLRFDLDNRIKAVLDYAQRIGLVSNDQNCMELTARWSEEATIGCRLTLRSIG